MLIIINDKKNLSVLGSKLVGRNREKYIFFQFLGNENIGTLGSENKRF